MQRLTRESFGPEAVPENHPIPTAVPEKVA